MPHEWTENFFKKTSFYSIFSYPKQQQQAISPSEIVTCDEKWILDVNQWQPAQWLDREAPKHFPKPNLHQRGVLVTVWWSAASLIHYSFLNPSKTIICEKHAQQLDEMHGKLQCLKPASVNRMGPTVFHDKAQLHIAQPNASKVERIGPRNFSLICHIHQTSQQLITTSSILKIFPVKCFHNQQDAENIFQGLLNPKAQIFMLQE